MLHYASDTLILDDLHQIKVFSEIRFLLDFLEDPPLDLLFTSWLFTVSIHFEILTVIILSQSVWLLVIVRLEIV